MQVRWKRLMGLLIVVLLISIFTQIILTQFGFGNQTITLTVLGLSLLMGLLSPPVFK